MGIACRRYEPAAVHASDGRGPSSAPTGAQPDSLQARVPVYADSDAEASIERKYCPDACSRCGQDWSEPVDGGDSAARLAAYVWRCVNCGHVDMRADPNHQRISSFRR